MAYVPPRVYNNNAVNGDGTGVEREGGGGISLLGAAADTSAGSTMSAEGSAFSLLRGTYNFSRSFVIIADTLK